MSEYLDSGIAACRDATDPELLDRDIVLLWKGMLQEVHPGSRTTTLFSMPRSVTLAMYGKWQRVGRRRGRRHISQRLETGIWTRDETNTTSLSSGGSMRRNHVSRLAVLFIITSIYGMKTRPSHASSQSTGGEMSPPNKTAYLSKTLYIRGRQCHKSLYLDRHRPELRGEATPELEALWASGHEVGAGSP